MRDPELRNEIALGLAQYGRVAELPDSTHLVEAAVQQWRVCFYLEIDKIEEDERRNPVQLSEESYPEFYDNGLDNRFWAKYTLLDDLQIRCMYLEWALRGADACVRNLGQITMEDFNSFLGVQGRGNTRPTEDEGENWREGEVILNRLWMSYVAVSKDHLETKRSEWKFLMLTCLALFAPRRTGEHNRYSGVWGEMEKYLLVELDFLTDALEACRSGGWAYIPGGQNSEAVTRVARKRGEESTGIVRDALRVWIEGLQGYLEDELAEPDRESMQERMNRLGEREHVQVCGAPLPDACAAGPR